MRIRKNAKISPLVASNSSGNTHLCQLNQSPWDVPIVDSSTPSPYQQVDGGNIFTGNGSFGDSIGALGRVASLKISVDDEEYNNIYGEEEEEEEDQEEENETVYCSKTDGEGNLVCGREAEDGHSLCNFHLVHFRSINNSVHVASKKIGKNKAAHRAKKSKSESNPYEIYYYSGFGPRWGRKRGTDHKLAEPAKEVVEPEESSEAAAMTMTTSSSVTPRNDNFKYFEDDYEEDDEDEHINDGNGKKRGRKPIKARSLKSLM